ncbi:MAG TPA: phosphotransferase family protein [Vicinamibacterales bacterium]|jgi:aminoglycoside phosphotransferase (APT) family kinase protein|nr:phosphotransferase family protein [Vicinamibacterales bacterium]
MPSDAREVRGGEQLDWPRLVAWLRDRLPACAIPGLDLTREPEVAQFPGGHSNLTYLIRFGDTEIVVRRPPFGPVAPTAHDMAREFRWLSAMHTVFPLAPRPYLLCEDTSVIGCVFYAMERRHGLVVRAEEPPAVAEPGARRRVSEALIGTLASLHAIDVTANGPNGLVALGKPAGFVERQVRGWTDRWHRSKTTPLAEMDALADWLRQRLPPDANPPGIVHGDFKLDNVMLDPDDVGRIVAVLDWEMSALGDPLVDLGILLAYWAPATTSSPGLERDALTTVTHRPGYFNRDEIIDHYATRSTRDLSNIRFYEIFAVFKIAVVIQQIYFRYVQGQTTDQRFATFDARVAFLARQAAALAAIA